MRIQCFNCHKVVSSEIPDTTIFAAIAECPECLRKKSDDLVLAKGRLTAESEWLQKEAEVRESLGWHGIPVNYSTVKAYLDQERKTDRRFNRWKTIKEKSKRILDKRSSV